VQFFVTKTGLDAFDTARAWGLAVLLNVLTQDEVRLQDASWAFILEPKGCIPQNAQLTGLVSWVTLFAAGDVQWDGVFVTQRGRQGAKKGQVRQILETQLHSLLSDLQRPDNLVEIGSGENVPGGLEPAAFKGLRHVTKASYREDQLKVSEGHWALSCLGMATCGTYRLSREAGQDRWLVLLPVPQNVHFNYFQGCSGTNASLWSPTPIYRRPKCCCPLRSSVSGTIAQACLPLKGVYKTASQQFFTLRFSAQGNR
jgi:hypothetical protein